MKKVTIQFLAFLTAVFFFTACEKDGTDIKDGDEEGKFEITVNGVKYEGTTVVNGAVMGIRTVTAECSGFYFGVIINEDLFTVGTTFDLDIDGAEIQPVITIGEEDSGNEESYFATKGTIKVVSDTKIEIDGSFYMGWSESNPEQVVKGYISSK